MRLKKRSVAQVCLLVLLWGCSGAEPTEPPMPPPPRAESWGDDAGALGDDMPPIATIQSPEVGARSGVGSVISFEGRGRDSEDGALTGKAFTWRVDLHQGERVQPFVPPISGMVRGAFTVPALEATDGPTWYRVYLQVKDSSGNTHSVFRDVALDVALERREPSAHGS
jgi:hypothetical protein